MRTLRTISFNSTINWCFNILDWALQKVSFLLMLLIIQCMRVSFQILFLLLLLIKRLVANFDSDWSIAVLYSW